MDKEIDIFLPYWWIAKHPPQGAWENQEVRFNSLHCLEKCSKYKTSDWKLSWDEMVCYDDNVRCIGYVSTITQEDPRDRVPPEFRQYINVMGKQMADALPVTLGLDCNRSVGESKVIRLLSIIHNGIILDLVCGFGGSVGEDVRAGFSFVSERTSFFL